HTETYSLSLHDALPISEALLFAFSSRSSAGSLPLNIQTQTTRLGVPPSIANFSASFGLSIGQNGCVGIYPSMLAIMVAPVAGVEDRKSTRLNSSHVSIS